MLKIKIHIRVKKLCYIIQTTHIAEKLALLNFGNIDIKLRN